jgi:hypothetical protein
MAIKIWGKNYFVRFFGEKKVGPFSMEIIILNVELNNHH